MHFFQPRLPNLNFRGELLQVPQVPHVEGHDAEAPRSSQRSLAELAIHVQSLVTNFILPLLRGILIRILNGESLHVAEVVGDPVVVVVVGFSVGDAFGLLVGLLLGEALGLSLGEAVGLLVGLLLGEVLGLSLGEAVGLLVGLLVGLFVDV